MEIENWATVYELNGQQIAVLELKDKSSYTEYMRKIVYEIHPMDEEATLPFIKAAAKRILEYIHGFHEDELLSTRQHVEAKDAVEHLLPFYTFSYNDIEEIIEATVTWPVYKE